MTEGRLRAITAVHFAEIADADVLNAALEAAFRREREGPTVRRTHSFGGRFENTYIDAALLPELDPVREFALASACDILGRGPLRTGFWFNEMPPGHNTSLHTHEENDELLSAVYYVTAPPASGRLLLHDDDALISVTPRAGLMVLFPPDLPHEVETNASGGTRLSVAFNFGPPQSAT